MPPFLNPLFLTLGLVAAALPILIHLFSRRRTREVRFPSLEFLQEVSRKKVRRLQLRQILLLVLRVLIIACFALAMARPTLRTTGTTIGRGSSTFAIVLDNSASMACRDPHATDPSAADPAPRGGTSPVPEDGTVFAAAKERALEIVALMQEGDRGILALPATPVRLPYPSPITDLGLIRQEVEHASLEASRADLPQAVERVVGMLSASKTLNRELYIVSDFQRIDLEAWQTVLGSGRDTTGTAGRRAAAIPEDVKVFLIPARTLPVDNLAIERLRLDRLGSGQEGGARVIASLVSFSEKPAVDVVVRALAEGEEGTALGETFVTVPPMGRAEATLLLRHLPGSGALRVSVTPDPLAWDNQAYLVTDQPGVRRVWIVSGGDAEVDPAARYLRLALDPAGNQEFFAVQTLGADDPALTVGIRADAVILLDVGRLSDAALEQVERFRANGGGLLVVTGERVDPRSYNTVILPKLASVELLGLQGDPGRPDVYRSLRVSASGHPIFEGFPAVAGGNLTAARFLRLLQARVGGEARVLAEFSGGVPALIEDHGTLVFTSAFDGRWSDLPTSGAFVPLVHRMVQYLVAQGGGRDRLLAGASIEETLDADRLAMQEAAFVDPQGTRTSAERSTREGQVVLKSPPMRLPGLVSLVRDDGMRLGLYAVNLDAKESDLRPAPEAWLPALFQPPAKVLNPEGQITRQLLEERRGRELWPILLVIVLCLLATESLLARGKILP